MSHKIYFEPNRLVIELIQDDASYNYKETQVDKLDATTTVVKSLPKSLIEKVCTSLTQLIQALADLMKETSTPA